MVRRWVVMFSCVPAVIILSRQTLLYRVIVLRPVLDICHIHAAIRQEVANHLTTLSAVTR